MDARIKKIFHRQKHDMSQSPLDEDHHFDSPNSNAALRTSLYDSASSGDPPQTGTHSIKGNYSAPVSPNRISPLVAAGPFYSPPHNPHHRMRQECTVPGSDGRLQPNPKVMGPRGVTVGCEGADERQRELPEIPVSQLQNPLRSHFDSQDYEVTAQRRNEILKDLETYPHASSISSPLKPLEKATKYRRTHETSSSLGASITSSRAPGDDQNPISGTSIPRKDAGNRRTIPASNPPLSSIVHQPLAHGSQSPTPNASAPNDTHRGERVSDNSLSGPTTKNPGTINAAEQIVEKAHGNSTYTDISETLAPGKLPGLIGRTIKILRT
jgi:hypothetical protein